MICYKGIIKKVPALLLAAVLTVPAGMLPALADDPEDEDISIDELVEEVYLEDDGEIAVDAYWNFPIALEDLDPTLLVLANKHYLLDKDYVSGKVVAMKQRKADKNDNNTNGGVLRCSGDMKLEERCALALVEMSEAARVDGYKLYLKSAYRSWQTQNTMYYNRLKKNKGKDDGWVSYPGASDHQTGLGCDVVPGSWREKSMNEKMAKEPECQWMAEHCQEFGFILRYPEDKQDITEINYEPWHMRYVGIPAATYIMENNLCLEEFNDELQQAIQDYLAAGGDHEKVAALIRTPTEIE